VRKRPYVVLFAVLLAAFTAVGANQVSSAGGAVLPTPASSGATSIEISKPDIYVHVVGEVLRPGLYMLPSASRLADVIALAGGFTSRAEPGSVNLARVLNDGEQFFVLSKSAYAASGGGQAASSGSGSKLISLNRASESELEALPRVGPALAARIVDWRSANGGFKSVTDLTKVSGFGDKMFAAVKGLVTL
jgi:competence protein ComEA